MGLAPSSSREVSRLAAIARCLSQFFNTPVGGGLSNKISQEITPLVRRGAGRERDVVRRVAAQAARLGSEADADPAIDEARAVSMWMAAVSSCNT